MGSHGWDAPSRADRGDRSTRARDLLNPSVISHPLDARRTRPLRGPMPRITNLLPGEPEPLGPTVKPDGINFAIHSAGATRIELLLFDNIADQRPSQIIPLS